MNKCSVLICKNESKIKGLCKYHYKLQWRRKKYPLKKDYTHKCEWPGCDKIVPLKKMCKNHGVRFRKWGDFEQHVHLYGSKSNNWRGGTSPYKNPGEHKRIRNMLFKKYNGKCQLCGSPAKQVHHIDRSRDNHNPNNLLVLCFSCHNKQHGRKTYKHKSEYMESKRMWALKDWQKRAVQKIYKCIFCGTIIPYKMGCSRKLYCVSCAYAVHRYKDNLRRRK